MIAKYKNALEAVSKIVKSNPMPSSSVKNETSAIKDQKCDIKSGMGNSEPKRRGRKPLNRSLYTNEKDFKVLKGPCGPGDTYGISMEPVVKTAENIISQVS